MSRKINDIQMLILQLMRKSSFNNFYGHKVADDLIKQCDKWIGCIWGRFYYNTLIPLRDIPKGIYNVDSLYLTTHKDNIPFIQQLAQNWSVDEIGFCCNGSLVGTTDRNQNGLANKSDKHGQQGYFRNPLGGEPEKDIAYFRLWWD